METKDKKSGLFSWFRGKLKKQEHSTETIMFADICRSTQIFETYGDVRARKILSKAISILIELTERHGGRVIKTIGDEVMATFPTSENGVKAAAQMHKIIADNSELAPHRIAIKVGLHHGDVLLEEEDVFGDAVNVAARMVSLAKANQIITTTSTTETLSELLRSYTRNLGPAKVRGKQEEIQIAEVIWQEDTSDLTILPGENAMTMKSQDNQPQSKLLLHYRGNQVEVGQEYSTFRLGREENNDLFIDEELASRNHASIEYRKGKFVLIDRSTNGTYVWMANGEKFFIHREEIHLYGQGVISLGRDLTKNNPELIFYKNKQL